MKRAAIEKAAGHLRAAREASERLDLSRGFRAYSEAWSDTLSHLHRFYSKLEQGAKGCPKSDPWFGRQKAERRDDPLLCYLHHARNSDEHGLDYLTQMEVDGASLHFPPTNEIHASWEMMIDDKGEFHIRNPAVRSPNGGVNRIELTNPRVTLAPVRDRGVNYQVPIMHRGKPIVFGGAPAFARLGIEALEAVLEEAKGLPSH